jgi:anti-anti-sigma factor
MDSSVTMQQDEMNGVVLLSFQGRLDAITSPSAEKQVLEKIQDGHQQLIFDFSRVEYLSSAGMRMLLSTTKKLKTISGKLVVCNVSKQVMDVLKMSGFDHVLDITETKEEAIKKIAS